jgi:hypothetical protein
MSVSPAARARLARQPGLGLAGITLVIPVALALGSGLGTPERSLLVLAPISTFALPVIVMIAFWWNDWPGTAMRAPLVGITDTLLVVAGGVLLTIGAQALVGHLDLRGVFDPNVPLVHVPTFPATMVLGGAIFAAMVQLTLVAEGGPLHRLDPISGGLLALALSCAAGVLLYLLLVDFRPPAGTGLRAHSGPLSSADLGAILVCVAVPQVAFYVVLGGWPFTRIGSRPIRIAVANVAVIAAGCLGYLALAELARLEPGTITAVAGSVVAGGLAVGMLFEGWLDSVLPAAEARALALGGVLLVSGILYGGLTLLAASASWTKAEPEEWIAYAGLNAIGAGVILHVAIGRRWPFAPPERH